ncbi:MAG TPA: EamA family transporter [Gemmatimonadales bacterium]|nr:EamA family transporter [Gemmatimonadales bacterium]
MRAIPPRLQLALAALLFSTGGAAIKATTLTGWQVASFRSGVAALTVLLVAPAARRNWGWRPLVVGVAYAATLILFVLANKLTTSANAIFLQSAAPLYMVLLGPLLLKEAVQRHDLVLMAAVGAGLALFFLGADVPSSTAPDPATGNTLAILSGVCWAFTVAGLRWMGSHDGGDHAVTAVAIGNLLACLVCLPLALPLLSITAGDVVAVLYLGVFQIAVAYLLVTAALRTVPALEASVLLLIEPAFNPVWAWLVHGERPSSWALLGGIVIVAATTAHSVWVARRAARARAGAAA